MWRRPSTSTIYRAAPAARCPATGAGMAVALADKLDTLAGIFAIGQKPSGTKDPFGLRRAAIGALRIVIEKKLPTRPSRARDARLRAAARAECRRSRQSSGNT